MNNELTSVLESIDEIYEALQSNRSDEAWNLLISLVDALQTILSVPEIERVIDIEKLNEILGSIVITMETKDKFMLADLLSYELRPILEELQD